jgi:hypothetical protein
VTTNDPAKPTLRLTIRGQVEEFLTISPKLVRLMGSAGQPLSTSVKIIPKQKFAFRVIEAKAKNGEHISVSIKEDEGSEGTGYLLTVHNLKKEKGRYLDKILLKTTSKIRPTIEIRVFGNIM